MNALRQWRPLAPFAVLRGDMDQLFRPFFDDAPWEPPGEAITHPAVEWFSRDGELVVRADLPGINPKDIDLSLEGDLLTIKGERKAERKNEGGYREVRYGRFERAVRLPAGIDAESAKATYRDGVLEITLKAPSGMVEKKIPVTVH